jgi:hypothetical protein
MGDARAPIRSCGGTSYGLQDGPTDHEEQGPSDGYLSNVGCVQRFLRTPTWATILIEVVLGVVFVTFAVLNAVGAATRNEGLMTAGLAAVGGLALGIAVGMTKHLLAARQATASS